MKISHNPGIGLKLGLVGLLLLAPLIIITGALIKEWRDDVGMALDERDGLLYVAKVRELLDPLTAHRGATTLALSQSAGATARSLSLETKVNEALASLREIDAASGSKFHASAAVAAISADWSVLDRNWRHMSIEDDRAAHNVLATRILFLNDYVATAARFAIDPQPASHYLLDAVGSRLLPIANLTGWMRSQLAAAAVAGALTGRDRDRLVSSYESLRSSMDLVKIDIAKVTESRDPRFPAMASLYDVYERTSGQFKKLTEQIFEGPAFAVSSDTIMEVGGHGKESVFALYDGAHAAALRLLDDRLHAAYRRVLITSTVTVLLTLLAFSLAARIRSQLARQLKAARAAFARMEAGHFDSRLIPETQDEAGDVVAALARMQASLKERIERDAVLAAVAEYTDTAVSTTDPSGRTLWVNAGFTRMTGIAAVDAVGQLIEDLMERKATDPAAWSQIVAARHARRPWRGEVRSLRQGQEYFALIESQPVFGDDSSVTGFILIETDVTERRRAAEALREARDAAEAGNRAKSAFLANMSHEIRTPLNGVIGMTGLLIDGDLNREQREFAEIVRSSGESLLAIINDILDLSKIEAGHLEIERLDFDLWATIESSIDPVLLQASRKHLQILLDIDPALPRSVQGDAARVRQIVLNLVSNAVKFSDRGDVGIRVRTIPGTQRFKLVLEVRDNGIGMTESQMAGLFRPFNQADASMTRRFGGTGLGLSIVKRLVDAMDGTIRVESRHGNGSTFHVEIPLEPAAAPFEFSPPRGLAGRHVMLIEHHPVNQRILQTQLGLAGLRLTLATHFDGACETWERLNRSDDLPQLILLVQDLPCPDGLSIIDRLRAATADPMPPVILLTTLGGARKTESVTNEYARVLNKPVKHGVLIESIATLLSQLERNTKTAASNSLPSAVAAKTHILLAEDNPVNQLLMVRLLERSGASVTLAANGLQAIEKLRDTSIDLVLMDCQMPDLDGYEATQKIRAGAAGPAVQNIPIIALTAHALAGDRERCTLAGMSDYMTKPVDPKVLEDMIRKYATRVSAVEVASTDSRAFQAA